MLIGLSALAQGAEAPIGIKAFAEAQNPPPYRVLNATESTLADLGRSVFVTQWAPTGRPSNAGRIGVGPLFNATACNACHRGGERGRGPVGDGPAPVALVIQFGTPAAIDAAESNGDPVYGRVLNTLALEGVQIEGAVTVEYREIYGYYYPYGGRWALRVPEYRLVGLSRGPLAPNTVLKPRVAPALFGLGLLEAVPEAVINAGAADSLGTRNAGKPVWHVRQGIRSLGRFGWQGDAISIRDQTTTAFAREMGLTSAEHPEDDCTPAEADCRDRPNAGSPEVSNDLVDAVVAYLRTLAVPESAARAKAGSLGSELFNSTGCAACHRPRLPVELREADGSKVSAVIAPYTDLRLHDLGMDMADKTASGTKVLSRWITAPLWGLGYRLKSDNFATFLHDGRARTTEEAVLWHSGEAAQATRKFLDLGPHAREALLAWIATL